MINYLNENVDHHIITIEDPIEFIHDHKMSTVISVRSASTSARSPKRSAAPLRQDPDVILVGEMRDLETIEAAITAAETGHVVFGTLHTTGAQGTVNRIIDVFRRTSRSRFARSSRPRSSASSRKAVATNQGRPRRRLRNARGHAGHRQPDSREQDVPHQLGDPDRRQSSACNCSTTTCSGCIAMGS